MIRLLLADVLPLGNPAVYAEIYANSSPTRRLMADSFRFVRDRSLSIGAAALLDIALNGFGLRERDMKYGFTYLGKPYFLNAPDIHFNISHSSEKVAVAVSDMEVGCDMEMLADIEPAVAERFFSRDEYEAVMSADDARGSREAFFRYWTLKESYMKAVGKGMYLPPDSFAVLPDASGDFSVSGNQIDTGFAFHTPSAIPGYACALCCRPECGAPEIEIIPEHRLITCI